MIDCRGRIITSSRLRHHEKNLAAIQNRRKPVYKNQKYKHILDNKQREYTKKRKAIEIKRINRLLLGKLQTVLTSDSRFDELASYKPRSLNINTRRKELSRINNENKLLNERLNRVAPTMSMQRLKDEHKINAKCSKRLRCFIPTIDVYVLPQSSNLKNKKKIRVPIAPSSKRPSAAGRPRTRPGRTLTPKKSRQKTLDKMKQRMANVSLKKEEEKPEKLSAGIMFTARDESTPETETETQASILHVLSLLAGQIFVLPSSASVTYKKFLHGFSFREEVRTAWSRVPGASPMTLKAIQTLSRCKAIDVEVLILQCGDADGAVQSLQSSQLSSPLSSSLRQLSNCNDDENIAVLFKKIDTDNDGLITFHELMTSLKDKEMQLFLRSVPSLAPFLNPQDIQQTIDPLLIRVDNENEDQLTQHTFTRLALAIINHMDIDVQTYKENAVKLDAIDQLFAIIDIDNDGVLSYAEILAGIDDERARRIINGQPSLKELLKPEAIKDKMLEIMNNSPDGLTLNRGAFRLFVAVDELVSLGGMFEDGEVYGDDY